MLTNLKLTLKQANIKCRQYGMIALLVQGRSFRSEPKKSLHMFVITKDNSFEKQMFKMHSIKKKKR